MRRYAVKEAFLTLQGEGAHAGRRAVFLRLAGCNLWSGREEDRATAVCRFCDTDFRGGVRLTAGAIADRVSALWGTSPGRFVVITGGEPFLQLDDELARAIYGRGFEIAVETNGSVQPRTRWVSWVTVSPKAGAPLRLTSGDELKVVFPQPDLDMDALAKLAFRHHWIQPMDGPALAENTAAAIAYCITHPRWRLSLQTHKLAGFA